MRSEEKNKKILNVYAKIAELEEDEE